jgi:hypothetical protein
MTTGFEQQQSQQIGFIRSAPRPQQVGQRWTQPETPLQTAAKPAPKPKA